jgi:capsular polysaccharide biosynthesis protein
LAGVFLLVLAISSLLALQDIRSRDWVASTEVFISAVPYGPPPTANTGLFSYESEGRQMTQDLSQVVPGRTLSTDLLLDKQLKKYNLSLTILGNSLSSSANGRTLTITARAPSADEANLIDGLAQIELLKFRSRYIGRFEAIRSDVVVLSEPAAVRSPATHIVEMWLLRLVLGAIVAVAIALGWDYLDDSIHGPADLERWLAKPVLATVD